jgi:hypothetical protein
MGGGIFVGVRYKDKKGQVKEVLMSRWTNDLPWRFMQLSFLEQGKEFNKFVKEAKPENEWPYSKLITEIDRDEYGVVLIDFINHEVYSRNDYCDIGGSLIHDEDNQIIENIFALIDKGLIGKVVHTDFRPTPTTQTEIPVDCFRDHLKETLGKGERSLFYNVSLNDTVFRIDNKSDRYPKLKEVKNWLKKNGWISPVNDASFTTEDPGTKIKWMKPL